MAILASNDSSLALPGFEHVQRFHDNERGKLSAKVLPGEYYVTQNDELISTVLGSCVAACIRDPLTGVGGMNHFMLPGKGVSANTGGAGERSLKYGPNAMRSLIDTIVRWKGTRESLEVKLFGGAAVMDFDMNQIGDENVACVRQYAREHRLNVLAEDLGGDWPRKVVFEPATGKVWVRRLRRLQTATVAANDRKYINGTRG
ncbi:MAG: chemoreceptor glutamine deamidase CheD [Pseudomonadota bacterium]